MDSTGPKDSGLFYSLFALFPSRAGLLIRLPVSCPSSPDEVRLSAPCPLHIQRRADRQATSLQDVGVNHCRPHILVAQQFLDGADVVWAKQCFAPTGGGWRRSAAACVGSPVSGCLPSVRPV